MAGFLISTFGQVQRMLWSSLPRKRPCMGTIHFRGMRSAMPPAVMMLLIGLVAGRKRRPSVALGSGSKDEGGDEGLELFLGVSISAAVFSIAVDRLVIVASVSLSLSSVCL